MTDTTNVVDNPLPRVERLTNFANGVPLFMLPGNFPPQGAERIVRSVSRACELLPPSFTRFTVIRAYSFSGASEASPYARANSAMASVEGFRGLSALQMSAGSVDFTHSHGQQGVAPMYSFLDFNMDVRWLWSDSAFRHRPGRYAEQQRPGPLDRLTAEDVSARFAIHEMVHRALYTENVPNEKLDEAWRIVASIPTAYLERYVSLHAAASTHTGEYWEVAADLAASMADEKTELPARPELVDLRDWLLTLGEDQGVQETARATADWIRVAAGINPKELGSYADISDGLLLHRLTHERPLEMRGASAASHRNMALLCAYHRAIFRLHGLDAATVGADSTTRDAYLRLATSDTPAVGRIPTVTAADIADEIESAGLTEALDRIEALRARSLRQPGPEARGPLTARLLERFGPGSQTLLAGETDPAPAIGDRGASAAAAAVASQRKADLGAGEGDGVAAGGDREIAGTSGLTDESRSTAGRPDLTSPIGWTSGSAGHTTGDGDTPGAALSSMCDRAAATRETRPRGGRGEMPPAQLLE